jgi:multidrug efflux pump subunit AcrB
VERRLEDQKVFVRWNGESAISIALEMQEGRNVIAVGEQVRALIAEMQPEFSEGVRVEIVADEPQYVEERLGKLMGSLQLGLVIVLALSLLGLGWRAGIVIAVSIPISITVAIAGIAYLGLELHQISIAALVIALGLVVDEDIIVVDNIQRHLDQGKSPADAAVDGLGEIHLAVLSGAATTIAAFIPLALMKGDIGDFIRTIPIAVTLMLIASVVVAHFFTPLLTAWLNGIGGARQRRSASRRHPFEPMYRDLLEWMLSHRAVVLVGFAAVFFGSTCGVGSTLWPPDFFNDADRHQFLAMIQLKPGSNVEDTDTAARRVEAYMAKDKRIANWTTYVGTGAPKFYYNQMTEGGGENIAMFVVNTKESVPFDQTRRVAEDLDAALEYEVPGVWLRSFVLKQGYGGGSDIAIFLQGDSIPVLRTLSDRVREIVEKVDGTKNVRDSYGYDPLSLEARVDFAKANQLGISSQDIATTLRIALDGTTATSFREDDEEIAIRVRLDADQRRSVSDLSDVHIYSPRVDAHVPLAQLASIEPVFKTSDIMRWGRKREGGVFADITAERTLMAVAQDVERAVNAGLTIPPGYEISFHGQQTEVTESFVSLARAGIGAIFLIYILLVIQFRTLSQPLLIILAIPMALTGAVWGLAVMGQPLGFMAFLGMISLIGIVVNDSIVLLDYINTLRRRGLQLREATIEGASTRLRAITLTSLTTVGGLLPLSVAGGTLFAPFGWTMIFGMLGSTALTLLVQPVAYMVLETRRSRTWDSAGIDGGQGAVESIGKGLEPAESV